MIRILLPEWIFPKAPAVNELPEIKNEDTSQLRKVLKKLQEITADPSGWEEDREGRFREEGSDVFFELSAKYSTKDVGRGKNW